RCGPRGAARSLEPPPARLRSPARRIARIRTSSRAARSAPDRAAAPDGARSRTVARPDRRYLYTRIPAILYLASGDCQITRATRTRNVTVGPLLASLGSTPRFDRPP